MPRRNDVTLEKLADSPILEFKDARGNRTVLKRSDMLSTRWVMLTFSIFLGILGLIWTILLNYLAFVELIDVTSLTDLQLFWIIGVEYAIGLGFFGGLLAEGGIKHHKISVANGAARTFWRGGPEMVIGIAMIVAALCFSIGLLIIVSLGIDPYVTAPVDLELAAVIVNIILPVTSILGGVLFAKAIRGKDKLAEAAHKEPIV